MLRSGCANSTSARRSSIEQTNFVFKPVQLHLEPANLFEQRFLLYLTVARLALAAVHKEFRHLLDGCLSPVADLHGVHGVLRSQLVERPLAAGRLQRYPRRELRTVLLSCRRHRPLPFATADSEINLLRGPNSGDHYSGRALPRPYQGKPLGEARGKESPHDPRGTSPGRAHGFGRVAP